MNSQKWQPKSGSRSFESRSGKRATDARQTGWSAKSSGSSKDAAPWQPSDDSEYFTKSFNPSLLRCGINIFKTLDVLVVE